MAGSGRRTFAPGEVLTASNVMNYLQDQAVMNFAGTAARGSAIGTAVSEGMVSYLADTNVVEVYDGSNWWSFDTQWTSYTPTLGSWTIGNGSVVGSYSRSGKTAFVKIEITIGSTTTYQSANTSISVPTGLNITWGLTSTTAAPIGQGVYNDATGDTYYVYAHYNSSNTVRVYLQNSAGTYAIRSQLSNTTPVTLASGDFIKLFLTYEIA